MGFGDAGNSRAPPGEHGKESPISPPQPCPLPIPPHFHYSLLIPLHRKWSLKPTNSGVGTRQCVGVEKDGQTDSWTGRKPLYPLHSGVEFQTHSEASRIPPLTRLPWLLKVLILIAGVRIWILKASDIFPGFSSGSIGTGV